MSQSQSQSSLAVDTPAVPSVHGEPLVDSYTWASEIPKAARGVPCILGVDEAGRGPVLGPLVYGIAYCPASFSDDLKEVGFADSKTLTAERRDALLAALIQNPENLGWATRTMSPQDISAGMLRKRPFNLNSQSTEATVELISRVLESGVDIAEIYVDTVGDPKTYTKTLQSYFPQARHKHIQWTVTSKADSIYPIVGAASIAAKVTRDRWVEDWHYAENVGDVDLSSENGLQQESSTPEESSQPPSPTKKGTASKKRKRPEAPVISISTPRAFWHDFGSGYPGDPNTVAYLQRSLDPVFGWPGVVRFSWATIKTLLDEKSRAPTTRVSRQNGSATATSTESSTDSSLPETVAVGPTGSRLPLPGQPKGHKVRWVDEPAQITSFFAAKAGKGAMAHAVTPTSSPEVLASAQWKKNEDKMKKDRKGIVKDLGIVSVGPGGIGGGL
ncbi:unnamed protein product [Sympodiomycopsis kandeliae]